MSRIKKPQSVRPLKGAFKTFIVEERIAGIMENVNQRLDVASGAASGAITFTKVPQTQVELSEDKLSTPRSFLSLTGNYASAVLLGQILYWSGKTDDPDGWFYKSHEDWEEELCMSETQVRNCMKGGKHHKGLKELGVETCFRKPRGEGWIGVAPVQHYRLNWAVFEPIIKAHLKEQRAKSQAKKQSKNKLTITEGNNLRPSQIVTVLEGNKLSPSYYTSTTTSTTSTANAVSEPSPTAQADVAPTAAPAPVKPPKPLAVKPDAPKATQPVKGKYTREENNRRADLAIAFGKYLGNSSRVDILRRTTDPVANDFPALTGEQFLNFLRWYAKSYPEREKLRKPKTISDYVMQWLEGIEKRTSAQPAAGEVTSLINIPKWMQRSGGDRE